MEPITATSDLALRIIRCAVLAVLGRPEEARTLLAEWEEGRLREYLAPITAAQFYAAWGEAERALAILERDYREGDKTLWNTYQGPAFDPIRENPRFVALLRTMKLPTTLRRRPMIPLVRSTS